MTGATGWVGREICSFLRKHGVPILRIGRRSSGVDIGWDCRQEVSLEAMRLLSGVACVIHCAGYAHQSEESEAARRQFLDVNFKGTERLVRACRSAGTPRFAFVSTIAVYGSTDSHPYREDEHGHGVTAYSRSKLLAESCVRESGIDYRIARLSTVFGVGDHANFARLASALSRRRFILPGSGSAFKSVISVRSAGELLARLALHDEAREMTVNLAHPKALTLNEICNSLCRVCRFPQPLRVPLSVLKLAGIFGDAVASWRPGFPYTSANLKKLTTSTVVDTSIQGGLFSDFIWDDFDTEVARAAIHYSTLNALL